MGLDGFSMSNLGLQRNLTTAQLANDVEATAKMALENQLPDVDGVGKKDKAGKKDPEAAFNPMVPFISDKKKKKNSQEQENDDSDSQQQNEVHIDTTSDEDAETAEAETEVEIEEPRYLFKISKDDEMIEMYDTLTNKIVKKLSAQEAAATVHDFTKLPGIFFNKGV